MPMCFAEPIRALLRPYLSSEDRLVHLKVRGKEVRPNVIENVPLVQYITKLHCGPPGCSEPLLYTR